MVYVSNRSQITKLGDINYIIHDINHCLDLSDRNIIHFRLFIS